MTARILLLLSIAFLCLTSNADAIFRKPDLEKVPIERLIKNLTEQLDKETKVTNTRYNLARVHAMAYALKSESCEVPTKRAPGDGPWFGPTPPTIPFKAAQTTDKEKAAAARKHLEEAIAIYQQVIKEQPNFLPGYLGLAWCLDQAGAKQDAIKAYRDVLDRGWDEDRKKKTAPFGGNFITKEAAGYLIPLLDADKDADEINSIEQRVAILSKLPRPVTPIAIPLKDGLTARDLEAPHASVAFDADGSGLPKRWTWITPAAAWLVHLPPSAAGGRVAQEQAKITSGLQLFGSVTFWCFWENGYQALSTLDDDGDGALTGRELVGLALWRDANSNGICDPGEVRSLAHHGIVSLSCAWQTDGQHPDRIALSPRGVTYQDGTTRPSFDLILRPR